MSTAFESLLSATIEHLHGLKEEGRNFVCLSPETLKCLREPVRRWSKVCSESSVPVKPAPLVSPPSTQPVVAVPTVVSQDLSSAQSGSITDIAGLRKSVLACVKCPHLVAARKNVVFGVGDIHAKLMFVGEAPGADEDAQGEPFVGAAGQLLTKIINTMGLSRQTVYIANILKCRPDTPGQKFGNRKPTLEEMKTCISWLEKQIEFIQPQVMVALGATAVEGLLGSCSGISRMRGNWQAYRGIPLMPTFHPSYLLRNAGLTDKRRVWEDMLQVMGKLGMVISEKQRNYFLKGG